MTTITITTAAATTTTTIIYDVFLNLALELFYMGVGTAEWRSSSMLGT